MVWRSLAKAQPQARDVQVCHDGALKQPCNRVMTTVPHDECTKGSTAMSSSKRVCPGRWLVLLELRLPWHLHRVEHPTWVKIAKLMTRALALSDLGSEDACC